VLIAGALGLWSPRLDARDVFEKNYRGKWAAELNLDTFAVVRSVVPLSATDRNLMIKYTLLTRLTFQDHWRIAPDSCELRHLEIIVLGSTKALSSTLFFPDEEDYTDATGVVHGRYFRASARIYIIPRAVDPAGWPALIAHELIHYFISTCTIGYSSNAEEHDAMVEFFRIYSPLYPKEIN
jgi:hypothetical protein